MRMAKAPQEHIDSLRLWLQVTEEISKIDPTNEYEWSEFKNDYEDDESFMKMLNHFEDKNGFNYEFYFDYFQRHISHIYGRIIFGFEVLLDNCCDPEKDYLDFNVRIKTALEKTEVTETEEK